MIVFPIPLGVFYIEITVFRARRQLTLAKISLYCTTRTQWYDAHSLPFYRSKYIEHTHLLRSLLYRYFRRPLLEEMQNFMGDISRNISKNTYYNTRIIHSLLLQVE